MIGCIHYIHVAGVGLRNAFHNTSCPFERQRPQERPFTVGIAWTTPDYLMLYTIAKESN